MRNIVILLIILGQMLVYPSSLSSQPKEIEKTPVIVITDLYHPAQDPGDNFDIITAFTLPQLDLKAVILDCTEPFRQPVAINPGAADSANGIGYGSYIYPFSYDGHNTFFKLSNLNFINKMDPVLQRYLAFTFQRTLRTDFLRAFKILDFLPCKFSYL